MGKLRGQITCQAATSIAPGSVASVEVRDVTLGCGPAPVKGSVKIQNPAGFPLSYELEFDESGLEEYSTLEVLARFERDGKLEFINNTRLQIDRDQEGRFKSNFDFHISKI